MLANLLKNAQTENGVTYSTLKDRYYDFSFPMVQVSVGGDNFSSEDDDMLVNDLNIELSAGFEASIASFKIYNVFDDSTGKFRYKEIDSQIMLGNVVDIYVGYLTGISLVFTGFIASIGFGYEGKMPYIKVTAMDVKGLMMSSRYAQQSIATSYSEAVTEILNRTGYESLHNRQGIKNIFIDSTPDRTSSTTGAAQNLSAGTIEMVDESDYEFVVKAAKKFNYEFFVDRGNVYFRKAKSNKDVLLTLGAGSGLLDFEVEYSLTGIVETVEARAMNAGDGQVITAQDKFPGDNDKISAGSKAKGLVHGSKKVYIDPTITTQAQADARVASLKEAMSYRLGTLEAVCVGIPDLVAGRFIRLDGMGAPVDNLFYLTRVEHRFDADNGFRSYITGRTNTVEQAASKLPSI